MDESQQRISSNRESGILTSPGVQIQIEVLRCNSRAKDQQMIQLLIAKSNEDYEIVIPKFVFNNDKYVKLNNVSKKLYQDFYQ